MNHYRQKSNITSTYSIRKCDEADYEECRLFLKKNRVAVGEYLVDAYRELDKTTPDTQRLKQLAWR